MSNQRLGVLLTLEGAKYLRGLKKSQKATKDAAGSMQKSFNAIKFTAVAAGITAVAASVTILSRKMISAASDAQETQAKFNTVFRGMEESANAWAVEFSDSVGRARKEVKSWMAELQDTFVPLGYAREKAAGLSKDLVTLAVDVASFNNEADATVIRDFTSALVGNHETVRKYGVIISESSIAQEALNQGINKTYKELSNQEKVWLRYNVLLKGTTDAQGDALRTGESYANQMKRFKANIDNLSVTMGNALLPKATEVVTKMNEWITANETLMKQNFDVWADNAVKAFDKVSTAVSNIQNLGSWLSWGKTAAKAFIGTGHMLTGMIDQKEIADYMAGNVKVGWDGGVTRPVQRIPFRDPTPQLKMQLPSGGGNSPLSPDAYPAITPTTYYTGGLPAGGYGAPALGNKPFDPYAYTKQNTIHISGASQTNAIKDMGVQWDNVANSMRYSFANTFRSITNEAITFKNIMVSIAHDISDAFATEASQQIADYMIGAIVESVANNGAAKT